MASTSPEYVLSVCNITLVFQAGSYHLSSMACNQEYSSKQPQVAAYKHDSGKIAKEHRMSWACALHFHSPKCCTGLSWHSSYCCLAAAICNASAMSSLQAVSVSADWH